MAIVKIPYSTDYLVFDTQGYHVKSVLSVPKAPESLPERAQAEIVTASLQNPIESKRLSVLAEKASRLLIITSDHTRPVPSAITLPAILREARSRNKSIEIKILIATGCHRATTPEEMIKKFGPDIVGSECIVNHDSKDDLRMVFKGIMPSGGELWLNAWVDWADLVISEGFIEPHFFAGFSGGRKSILPGIASERTVYANHCAAFIASPEARTGNLDNNPIHNDMLYAASAAKLAFIINVVIDENKKVSACFSGHPVKAHEAGCAYVKAHCSVKPVEADIVITSNGGYPLDQNLYQAVKGMTAAEACVRQGGAIIMATACNDGLGGEEFFNWFANASSPKEVFEKITAIPQEKTIADQWQAQILARILLKAHVIVVSDKLNPQDLLRMHMQHAATIKEAVHLAEELTGRNPEIVIIPDGVGVIVTP